MGYCMKKAGRQGFVQDLQDLVLEVLFSLEYGALHRVRDDLETLLEAVSFLILLQQQQIVALFHSFFLVYKMFRFFLTINIQSLRKEKCS